MTAPSSFGKHWSAKARKMLDEPSDWGPKDGKRNARRTGLLIQLKLMCDADTGVLTYVWVKGHSKPFPDFRVQHKCRNFDAVLQWVKDHQTYQSGSTGIKRVQGAKEMEHPPERWDG
ncbi:hypothetical protein BU26DRAFT_523172 [Trematosphaeria pertusa]|uniref:Uncharacterized protein n=1 Tax=Trematosphaeria pertusa TaxID=390896 RepID=A0A6A6I3J5_9PLEO|nr:uncharacterized protein BU26DRAFT_523172 [Trematosphaeria pertusa]KAF2244522.1 hypothetical protein BU26DRAFT_523172 [Trematosphaeria pertusa]